MYFKKYQVTISFEEFVVNDKVESYLIEQGKEEEDLKKLMK